MFPKGYFNRTRTTKLKNKFDKQDFEATQPLTLDSPAAHKADDHHTSSNCEKGNHQNIRKMENDHWAIPFAVGFNIIKVHEFEPQLVSILVDFEMFIILKFSGCPE